MNLPDARQAGPLATSRRARPAGRAGRPGPARPLGARLRLRALVLVLCAAPLASPAQVPAAGESARETGPAAADPATELEPVRVLGQRPPRDPFAFDNPVQAEGTAFSRSWNEPPSLEEVGMRGGYVQMAINKGLELTARGVRKLPFWQHQVADARARPPPLDEAQLARAKLLDAEVGEAATTAPPPAEPVPR